MPLRDLADSDHLPELDRRYVLDRPAIGLAPTDPPPRILLLYGSLREWSFSRLCVEEAARLLLLFGCETRVFDPSTLPLPDGVPSDDHPAVHELRELLMWSEGQVRCSLADLEDLPNMLDSLPPNGGPHQFLTPPLQHRVVEHSVRQEPLQPALLVLKHLELTRLRHLHAAIGRLPLLERRTAHAVLTAHVRHRRSRLLLTQNRNDLLLGKSAALHRRTLHEGL